jgi:hypothetical protein
MFDIVLMLLCGRLKVLEVEDAFVCLCTLYVIGSPRSYDSKLFSSLRCLRMFVVETT